MEKDNIAETGSTVEDADKAAEENNIKKDINILKNLYIKSPI